MEVFDTCHVINDALIAGDEVAARNLLIQLLAELGRDGAQYPEVLNELIRATGLYPYLQVDNASWSQQFVHEAFAVDVGSRRATLHREQSLVLARLLDGQSVAVSAPTSFGKSFIIDAFIAAKNPETVVIIVPTIALMDETRRRIFKKFSRTHTIITAPDMELGQKSILIFPQERAFGYLNRIRDVDLLVVDEFYKASRKHDKDRSPSLIKAILKLSKKAKQRYYLAPNIKSIEDNVFTRGMEFLQLLDFNTVYLEKYDLYRTIDAEARKGEVLMELLAPRAEKSLIYAGTYSEIRKVAQLVIDRMDTVERPLTAHFAHWLRTNYQKDWILADVVERGVGVHNGRMHRCLSQMQIKIFEAEKGFDSIVSTSSIIEGVNTSAQNVIIWRSKIGSSNLKDFAYKNIIGRGGRMFKHFVGKIFLLDAPPKEEDAQLEIEFPDEILGDLDEEADRDHLDDGQIERIIEFRDEMSALIGRDNFYRLKRDNTLQDSDSPFLLSLARDMSYNPGEWRGFGYLNSDNPAQWEKMLYKIVGLKPGGWDAQWSKVIAVTKALAFNWRLELPEVLRRLKLQGIDIEEFFQLERTVTFKLSALLSDANELYKIIIDPNTDISKFIRNVSHAFLPGAVYHLEEYGLPRMISKKIDQAGMIDFSDPKIGLAAALDSLRALGPQAVGAIESMSRFDRYVIRFFFDGITPDPPQPPPMVSAAALGSD